jgi:urea transport system substrate-binding protein
MKARSGFGARMRSAILALATASWSSTALCDEGPIKIGILHSQTGSMAISEAVLTDTIKMLVEQQNAKGGLLGRKLEPVIADPKSEPDVFRSVAEKMLRDDKVTVVFGGWTSASRRAMLPVFEELNGLLFYPVQFEGQESSRNIFYTGAVPNQQTIPALRYLMSKQGGSIKRWYLVGTDYVYPRTANAIVEAYLRSTGVGGEDITVRYMPFAVSSWEAIVAEIGEFATTEKKAAVISTINGDSNIGFYEELGRQGLSAARVPVMAFSVGERELARMEPKLLEGHLASWSYFSSVGASANEAFVKSWRDFTKEKDEIPNDPMEAATIGFRMWTQAVAQAGTVEVNAVRQAMYGQRLAAPSGFEVVMQSNHMLSKPAMIAKVNDKGAFEVVWRSQATIAADAWSKYLAATARLTADWTFPWICGGCTEPTVKD